MVEELTYGGAVVNSASLFTVHGVDSLKPEAAEPAEQPDPVRQYCSEIHGIVSDY